MLILNKKQDTVTPASSPVSGAAHYLTVWLCMNIKVCLPLDKDGTNHLCTFLIEAICCLFKYELGALSSLRKEGVHIENRKLLTL